MSKGLEKTQKLSCVLGPFNELQIENIKMLSKISNQEEVSFHMSGTEAVMCAVRVARFNAIGRNLVVTFSGAYHGWWDGMQPYAGNERLPVDVLCLKDLNAASLKMIQRRRHEICAVLVNPLQCFHPNASPPSDLVLASNTRSLNQDTDYYREWLHQLRAVCDRSNVTLIFDEVYTGFRLAPGGAQEFFGVHADIVTYGKTVAGGNPIGVVCGPKRLMNRTDTQKAARVAYVIGTFAGHPSVMGSMNEFLSWQQQDETRAEYDKMHSEIERWAEATNRQLSEAGLPLQMNHFLSIWSMVFTSPGRYHWLLQYYLKDEGVNLSWVGTGRCLFSLDWTREDYEKLTKNIVRAAERMKEDGWWDPPRGNVKLMVGAETLKAILASMPARLLGLCGF